MTALRDLCKDKRNAVFVLSGKRREELVEALGPIPGLGPVAEAGYFFRRPNAPTLAALVRDKAWGNEGG